MNAPEKLNKANVYQKLNACRVALQGIQLKKSGNNKFAGYSYFELGDFLPTINNLFNEHGLCAITSFGSELASLVIHNCDKPEEKITFMSPMADAQLKGCHPIQNLGAVETYQRRYLYMAALEIVEHEAIDASEPTRGKNEGKRVITPTTGTAETLSDADKEWLKESAIRARQAFDAHGVEAAIAVLDRFALEDVMDNPDTAVEAEAYRWTLIDSTTRAAIKKARAAKIADSLTAQA